MPTVINTGATLTLSINSVARSEQITSVVLSAAPTRNRYKLIGNTESQVVVDTVWTMDVDIFLDWSSGTSDFADALWTAYTTAPNTPITYSLAQNGQTFTGSLYPECPPVGGAADDAHTWSASFQLTGAPTKA